jgi:hypothetical protein
MGHGAVPLKEAWARQNHASLRTVIVDIRGGEKSPTIYSAKGVGSMTFGNDDKARAKTVSGGYAGLKGLIK